MTDGIILTSVYTYPNACEWLYELLKQRSNERSEHINISHTALPPYEDHVAFFGSNPYRLWLLILDNMPVGGDWEQQPVGYISATKNNEIGIIIDEKYRGAGYGKRALKQFIELYQPLKAIPSQRLGQWVANIHPLNDHSRALFVGQGFHIHQLTYVLDN